MFSYFCFQLLPSLAHFPLFIHSYLSKCWSDDVTFSFPMWHGRSCSCLSPCTNHQSFTLLYSTFCHTKLWSPQQIMLFQSSMSFPRYSFPSKMPFSAVSSQKTQINLKDSHQTISSEAFSCFPLGRRNHSLLCVVKYILNLPPLLHISGDVLILVFIVASSFNTIKSSKVASLSLQVYPQNQAYHFGYSRCSINICGTHSLI